MRYFGCMLLRRRLAATLLVLGFVGVTSNAVAQPSMAYYLKMPEVHNYRLTEPKLQAYDRIERRILSAKPSDPLVKAMLQKPPEHASLDVLEKSLEKTPLKPLIEGNGMTIREWFMVPIILRGAAAADSYYEKTRQLPGGIVSIENLTFYVNHKSEVTKMMSDWSDLMAKQEQAVDKAGLRKH